MSRLAWLLVLILGDSIWPSSLGASGGKDLEDGWLLPVARVLDLLPTGTSLAGTDEHSTVWFQGGLARLYGMVDLPLQRIASGLVVRPLTAIFTWQALGRDLYREEQFQLRLVFGTQWHVSVAGGIQRLAVTSDEVQSQIDLELALRSPVEAPVTVQVAWALLAAPAWHAGRSQRRWLWLTGRLDNASWAVTLDRSGAGVPSLQGELLLKLVSSIAWGVRSEPVTGSLGFITVWRHSSFLLRSSHIVHPDLGLTHRWSLAWGALSGIW